MESNKFNWTNIIPKKLFFGRGNPLFANYQANTTPETQAGHSPTAYNYANPQNPIYYYNPYQFYQYPQYSPNSQVVDINASMKSQTLPSTPGGYREIRTFDAPHIGKGKLYQLDNGQKVVIIPKKGPTTIKTFVKVGSFNEARNRGISHYIEHNLFNGSSTLAPNEFVENVTKMGGQYNASTNTCCTDYFIKSPMHNQGDFEKSLAMHADMLLNPTFTEKTLKKEKGVVIREIQMYEDDPSDKAYNLMIKNLFGIKANYQGLIAGSSRNIANLNKQDVSDYYNEWYTPGNMTTVIVGEVNPEQTINVASRLFNQRKPSVQNKTHFYEPLKPTQKPVRKDIKSSHVNAVMLNMAFAGPKNNDIKDTVATMALCTALTGYDNARLTKTLKNFNTEGSIDISAINPDYNDPQFIALGATFNPGQEEEGLKAIYSTLQEAAAQPVSQQELFIVKNKLKNSVEQISENSMGVANLVGQALTDHGTLSAYTDITNQIDSLTPQDIQRAAQKYLDLNKTSIVMVHPEKQIGFGFAHSETIAGVQPQQYTDNNDRFKLKNIKEYNLPNNLHVAINDNPDSIRTSAHLSLKTDDIKTIKPGVADILSLMLNKGSSNYTEEQLHDIIDSNNLGVGAGAGGSNIELSVDCPKEKLPMAIGVMKEILYNPDLSQEKFEKAREELKVMLSSLPKDPEYKAMEVLLPEFNAGNSPEKTLANIDKVTLQDVQTLYKQIITDSQGKISIDGPISKTPGLGQQVFTELQTNMAFVDRPHPVKQVPSGSLPKTIVLTESEPRNQADIVQLFKIKENQNIKDKAALYVLNEILGGNSQSRLFTDLREKQKLAYKVKSIYSDTKDYGIMKLLIKTTTEDDIKGPTRENVKKSLDGFKNHINTLISTPVSEEELKTGKLEAKTKFINGTESSFERTISIQNGLDTLYGADYHNQMLDAIDQLSPQDIQNAAKVFLDKPSVISMIASPDTIKDMNPYLQTLGKVQEVKPEQA